MKLEQTKPTYLLEYRDTIDHRYNFQVNISTIAALNRNLLKIYKNEKYEGVITIKADRMYYIQKLICDINADLILNTKAITGYLNVLQIPVPILDVSGSHKLTLGELSSILRG
jgi:hypothetical protein